MMLCVSLSVVLKNVVYFYSETFSVVVYTGAHDPNIRDWYCTRKINDFCAFFVADNFVSI